MKKELLNIFYLAIITLAISSCSKYSDVAVNTPDDFAVTTAKQTFKVGDSVVFNFSSGPDMIVFYSGEAGKNYANKDRNLLAGTPKLVFQTNMTQGLLTNPDSMRLYVTTGIKGYDSLGVVNTNWTEITSRNTKWPTSLSSTFVTSDSIDLTDFKTADSVNFAFRATGKKYANAAQRKWQIQNLNLTNFLSDGTSSPLFNTFANTGWVQANLKNNPTYNIVSTNYQAWNVGQAGVNASNTTLVLGGKACNSNGIPIQTAYPITFDPSAVVNIDDNDDWLITGPVNLKTVKPDIGNTIKNPINTAVAGFTYYYYSISGLYASYFYKYTTPGIYNVTFVAQNVNNNNNKQVVRQLQITITP